MVSAEPPNHKVAGAPMPNTLSQNFRAGKTLASGITAQSDNAAVGILSIRGFGLARANTSSASRDTSATYDALAHRPVLVQVRP